MQRVAGDTTLSSRARAIDARMHACGYVVFISVNIFLFFAYVMLKNSREHSEANDQEMSFLGGEDSEDGGVRKVRSSSGEHGHEKAKTEWYYASFIIVGRRECIHIKPFPLCRYLFIYTPILTHTHTHTHQHIHSPTHTYIHTFIHTRVHLGEIMGTGVMGLPVAMVHLGWFLGEQRVDRGVCSV
jgi:hypothetical protein